MLFTTSARRLCVMPLLCASIALSCSSDEPTRQALVPIVGGKETSMNPEIGYLTAAACGGALRACTATLIRPRYALTAAHCLSYLSGHKPGKYGTISFYDTAKVGTPIASSNVLRMRSFGTDPGKSDVALLELENAISLPPAKLATSLPGKTTLCRAMGYGCTGWENGKPKDSGVKRYIDFHIGDSFGCAGDSGGPLYVDDDGTPSIWGVMSTSATSADGGWGNVVALSGAISKQIHDWENAGGKFEPWPPQTRTCAHDNLGTERCEDGGARDFQSCPTFCVPADSPSADAECADYPYLSETCDQWVARVAPGLEPTCDNGSGACAKGITTKGCKRCCASGKKKTEGTSGSSASCGCAAGVDNFCSLPPASAGCAMTFPGGYCDPNGDGSYTDGDWVQGYQDFQAKCASTSGSGGVPGAGGGTGGGSPSPTCPCASGLDNFCSHPPSTNGCPMTFPGGYCDPNGDASYTDGDWVQGYYGYQAQCSS
jgi:hypothetical protein